MPPPPTHETWGSIPSTASESGGDLRRPVQNCLFGGLSSAPRVPPWEQHLVTTETGSRHGFQVAGTHPNAFLLAEAIASQIHLCDCLVVNSLKNQQLSSDFKPKCVRGDSEQLIF